MPPQATSYKVLSRAEIAEIEARIGVKDPDKFYDEQRKDYEPWLIGILRHEWFFDKSQCDNCPRIDRLTVLSGQKRLCLKCLQTGIPWYPTGWVQPKVMELVSHSRRCTSHYSSTILDSMMNSKETSGS